jgi:AraC-like DNA-binding protein
MTKHEIVDKLIKRSWYYKKGLWRCRKNNMTTLHGLSLREAASLEGLESSENLDDKNDKISERSKRLYQRERTILEVTELICKVMNNQNISRADLAKRTGKSRSYITQLLNGTNMTVRTISDVLFAMGCELKLNSVSIQEKK